MGTNLPALIPETTVETTVKTPMETPIESPVETPVSLAMATQLMRIPAHGGGLLRQGGTNRGGPGRPPSAVKAAMREAIDERLHILEAIADDPRTPPRDRIRALELLARYGLGVGEDEKERQNAAHIVSFGTDPDLDHVVSPGSVIWKRHE
jgi:hypothetical protein